MENKDEALQAQVARANDNIFFVSMISLIIISCLSTLLLFTRKDLAFASKCGKLNELIGAEYNVGTTETCKVHGRYISNEEELDTLINVLTLKNIIQRNQNEI